MMAFNPDTTKTLEYYALRDKFITMYHQAGDDAAGFFALDTAPDLEKRLDSMAAHYDQLVFWRCEEAFDMLPPELRPSTPGELDDLISYLYSINPIQRIKCKVL